MPFSPYYTFDIWQQRKRIRCTRTPSQDLSSWAWSWVLGTNSRRSGARRCVQDVIVAKNKIPALQYPGLQVCVYFLVRSPYICAFSSSDFLRLRLCFPSLESTLPWRRRIYYATKLYLLEPLIPLQFILLSTQCLLLLPANLAFLEYLWGEVIIAPSLHMLHLVRG